MQRLIRFLSAKIWICKKRKQKNKKGVRILFETKLKIHVFVCTVFCPTFSFINIFNEVMQAYFVSILRRVFLNGFIEICSWIEKYFIFVFCTVFFLPTLKMSKVCSELLCPCTLNFWQLCFWRSCDFTLAKVSIFYQAEPFICELLVLLYFYCIPKFRWKDELSLHFTNNFFKGEV